MNMAIIQLNRYLSIRKIYLLVLSFKCLNTDADHEYKS